MENINNTSVFLLTIPLQRDSLPRGLIGQAEWPTVLLGMSQALRLSK